MSYAYRTRRKERQKMNRQHVRALAGQQAQIIGAINELARFRHRGLFGRMKWILFGR